MSRDIFDTNFKNLTHGDFIDRLNRMADALEKHPAYLDPVPDWIPGPALFRQHAEQLSKAVAAVNENPQNESEKMAVRAKGELFVTIAAQYLVMYSTIKDDPVLLQNAGLPLKKRSYTKGANKVPPCNPTTFTVQNGAESGSIIATVNKGYRIGSVELQIAEGDAAQEYSWRTLDFFYECRMDQKGLEPIRKYHFRARFKAPGGSGPWSDVVALVVI